MARSNGRFEGSIAVVTGAASGIGRAVAEILAREGANLVLIDFQSAEQTRDRITVQGGRAVCVQGDVSSADLAEQSLLVATQNFTVPNILANVAGIPNLAKGLGIDQLTLDEWNKVLAVNLTGPFLMCKAKLPEMQRERRGAIVNVSSLAGRLYSINATPAYSSSKAGLLGLTRHLASDYGSFGIPVDAICPGAVDTPMLRSSIVEPAADDPGAQRRRERGVAARAMSALGRMSTAEEQAAAVAFLASDEAAFITGVALDINGGFYMA